MLGILFGYLSATLHGQHKSGELPRGVFGIHSTSGPSEDYNEDTTWPLHEPNLESLENKGYSPSGRRASSIANTGSRRGAVSTRSGRLGWRERSYTTLSVHCVSSSEDIEGASAHISHSRPYWKPQALDYQKFEKGGEMYHSLHRHHHTNPEEWYKYTDVEIEVELLRDYSQWLSTVHKPEANDGYFRPSTPQGFYTKLAREVNEGRIEMEHKLDDIKEELYQEKIQRKAGCKLNGRRVQEQFNRKRKAWTVVNSSDSEWDVQEWAIFGEESRTDQLEHKLTQWNLAQLTGEMELQHFAHRRSLQLKLLQPYISQLVSSPKAVINAETSDAPTGPIESGLSCQYPWCRFEIEYGERNTTNHVRAHFTLGKSLASDPTCFAVEMLEMPCHFHLSASTPRTLH